MRWENGMIYYRIESTCSNAVFTSLMLFRWSTIELKEDLLEYIAGVVACFGWSTIELKGHSTIATHPPHPPTTRWSTIELKVI